MAQSITFKQFVFAAAFAFLGASSGYAAPVSYHAILNGASEFPSNGSAGTGFADVTIDTILHTLYVSAFFSGLSGTTTASHIHCCTSAPLDISLTAGVATQTPSFIGFPLGVTSGTFSNTFDTSLASTYRAGFITSNGGTPLTAEAALAAGLAAGTAYYNIHTSAVGTGEIRGFLTPVPEPEAYTMLLAGLGLLGFVGRRRKQKAA